MPARPDQWQLRRLRFRAEDPVQLNAEEIAQLLLYQGLFLFLSGHSDQQNQPHTDKTEGGEQKDVPKYESRDRRTDQQDDAQQDTDILNELTAPQFFGERRVGHAPGVRRVDVLAFLSHIRSSLRTAVWNRTPVPAKKNFAAQPFSK